MPIPLVGDGCYTHGIFPAPPPCSVNLPGLPCPECWVAERDKQTRNFITKRLQLQGEAGPGFSPWEDAQEEDLAVHVDFHQGDPYVARYAHPGSLPHDRRFRRLEMSVRLAFWQWDHASYGVSFVWLEMPG